MISVHRALQDNIAFFAARPSSRATKTVASWLSKVVAERELNAHLDALAGFAGLDFVEAALDRFDFGYRVEGRELDNIPAEGPLVIVANHPLGALDALALIDLVGSIRPDLRVVANDVLWQFEALRSLLLPVRNMGGRASHADLRAIHQSLRDGAPILMFPAGEVSRLRPNGVRDSRWRHSFVQFAQRADAPIVPIQVAARNSSTFYGVSMLNKPAAALLLPREMLRQQGSRIGVRIGQPIPLRSLAEYPSPRAQALAVRRQLYRLSKRRRSLPLSTEIPVAHPERRAALRAELKAAELLGQTPDGKQIYLFDYADGSAVMRELGRLRELTFRAVGEGTQGKRDIDQYDHYYRHLVLWDDASLEIAGAYRFCEAATVVRKHGVEGLYTNELFSFDDGMDEVFARGMELGRSFVQPRYWNSRSLDYLWFGIGAWLARNPRLRYLFGSVSLSHQYPELARRRIVDHYRRHYPAPSNRTVVSRAPLPSDWFKSTDGESEGDVKADFRTLKGLLTKDGLAVPTLFKQYADLTEFGGVSFLAFAVDNNFGACIDGLVLVDLKQLKAGKRRRYINVHQTLGEDGDG